MKLKLNGVVKTFGTHRVLDGISLEVNSRALVLLGRSGSGKTTLLRVLGGLETPDAGTLELAGEASLELGDADASSFALDDEPTLAHDDADVPTLELHDADEPT